MLKITLDYVIAPIVFLFAATALLGVLGACLFLTVPVIIWESFRSRR